MQGDLDRMSSALEKSFGIIELLAAHPSGLTINEIVRWTDQPASGVHRTLQELGRLGYVRQLQAHGSYILTMKLPAMGLAHLSRAGISDIAQPILDQLAKETAELIRLSVVDGENLVWVAVAQGATSGLRYDPGQEQGVVVHLASSAAGLAWMSAMGPDEILTRVARQGVRREEAEAGAGAPASLADVLERIGEARRNGYSISIDSYIPGMGAMAVPVRYGGDRPVRGCLSIAGPAVRMTPARMAQLAPLLKTAADDLGTVAAGSQYFQALVREHEGASVPQKGAT